MTNASKNLDGSKSRLNNVRKIREMAETIRKSNNSKNSYRMTSSNNQTIIINTTRDENLIVTDTFLVPPNEQGILQKLSTMSTDANRVDATKFKATTLRKDTKAARFLFIIVLIFFLCWV